MPTYYMRVKKRFTLTSASVPAGPADRGQIHFSEWSPVTAMVSRGLSMAK